MTLKRDFGMRVNASKMDGSETLWKYRLKANPKITLDDLALKLGNSRRTVTRIIKLRKIYATLNRLLHTSCLVFAMTDHFLRGEG